jgi:hypothetical protein
MLRTSERYDTRPPRESRNPQGRAKIRLERAIAIREKRRSDGGMISSLFRLIERKSVKESRL